MNSNGARKRIRDGAAGSRVAASALLHFALLVVLSVPGCLPDAKIKIPYNDTPVALDDGWPLATPESQGFDRAALTHAYEVFFSEDDYVPARSLLVVRNGYLVAEGYCREADDIREKRAIQSATKSVTSILTGIAVDLGLLGDFERTLYDIIPDKFGPDPAKRTITLRQLMTMKSGIDFDNDVFTLEMEHYVRGDGIAHILGKPLAYEPGTVYNYQDCDPHLLSAAIARLAGISLEEFAVEHLFRKIGISDYVWLKHHDGTTYGGYGLYLTPRDMARIGNLMVDGGHWEGEQVVSENWVYISTAKQTSVDPENDAHGFDYGYYWWRVSEVGAFTAYGHGGQYIFVVPAKDLVIVLTAEPDTDGETAAIDLAEFLPLARLIIDAASD